MRATTVSALLCMVLLAGCSSDDQPDENDQASLVVPSGSGLLRGVVVDDALRPLAKAAVSATGEGRIFNETSDDAGEFAIVTAPGVYLVRVSKPGYSALEQAVTVEASASSKAVLFQLPVELSTASYATQMKLEVFLECSAGGAAVCAAPQIVLCFVAGQLATDCPRLREDTTTYFIESFFTATGRIPTHVQVEGVWKATQPAGEAINFAIWSSSAEEWNTGATGPFFGNHNSRSPMVARFNETQLNETEVGTLRGLRVGLYSGSNIDLGDPLLSSFTGATVNQRIDLYVTAFYGYVPDSEWTMYQDGTVPPPP